MLTIICKDKTIYTIEKRQYIQTNLPNVILFETVLPLSLETKFVCLSDERIASIQVHNEEIDISQITSFSDFVRGYFTE